MAHRWSKVFAARKIVEPFLREVCDRPAKLADQMHRWNEAWNLNEAVALSVAPTLAAPSDT